MDPVSMILAFALKNPQAANQAISAYTTPGPIDAAQLQSSLADFAQEALTCYHPSARFRGVDVLGAPWREQSKFGAEGSVVMRISLAGLSGTEYQMIVAGMVKGSAYRAFVLQENTVVPYNKRCQLEHWVTTSN